MQFTVKTIVSAILILVLAYLAFFYRQGSIGIINATAGGTAKVIKTLQARG